MNKTNDEQKNLPTSRQVKVAINGFGRIGRSFFKLALKNQAVEIVAINDLGDIENMAYLLKYDSVQRDFGLETETGKDFLKIGEQKIPFYSEKNPTDLPWKKLEVDVVAECTGVFNSAEKSQAHLDAGARKVVLSGPGKDCENILMEVNDIKIADHQITSNGSCTTNAVTLILKSLDEEFTIENSMMTTVHSYTSSQSLVDGSVKPGKDVRRGRAAAQNILPTTTGSAELVPQIYKNLKDKFDAIAIRVPTITGSLVDLTLTIEKETTFDKVNNFLERIAKKYSEILKTTTEPLVSSDIIGDTHAGIIDLNFTRVSKKMIKLFIWYDNETGYSQSLLQHVIKAGS